MFTVAVAACLENTEILKTIKEKKKRYVLALKVQFHLDENDAESNNCWIIVFREYNYNIYYSIIFIIN